MTPAAHVLAWRRHKTRAAEYAAAFPQDPGWEIVFLFYAALHLLDAYLASKGDPKFVAETHPQRRQVVYKCPELGRNFQTAYFGLYDLSVSVRYLPEFVAKPNNYDTARRYLTTVESFLVGKLRLKVSDVFEGADEEGQARSVQAEGTSPASGAAATLEVKPPRPNG